MSSVCREKDAEIQVMREAIKEASMALGDFMEWQPSFNHPTLESEWAGDQEKAQAALAKLQPFIKP